MGVRFFTVYGPRQRPDMAFTPLLEALDAGSAFRLFGDGSASRSFTFVADAAAGMVAAMERGRAGELYNIGGGEEATMIEAIALAEQLAGRELDVERHGVATGDVRRTRADVAKAERELDWRPTTPLADGLRAQWEWVAARVAARVSEVRRRDGVDLDAEREVDLRSAWTRISDALVAAARRSRPRRDPRRARLGRERRRLPRRGAHLPRPAVHPGRAAASCRASRRTRRR